MSFERPVRLNLDGEYRGYLSERFSLSEVEDLLRKCKTTVPFRKTETRLWYRLFLPENRFVKEVLVKQEDPLKRWNFLKWMKYLFVGSSLSHSWQMSRYLLSKGVSTPRPVGFFEKKCCGVVVRSYLLSEFLPDAKNLIDHLNDPLVQETEKQPLLSDLSDLVGAFHRHGFYHGDLKGGNVLVERGRQGSKIHLIDLEASRVYSSIPPAKQLKELSRLNRALIGSIPESGRLRSMRSYLQGQEGFRGGEDPLLRKMEVSCKTRLIKKVLAKGPSILKELRYGIKNILVIKMRYIGDALLTTPLLDTLKEAFPEASLSALVNRGTEAVLLGNPALREVLVFDRSMPTFPDQVRFLQHIRRKKFDLVIDLTDADRSAFVAYYSGAPLRAGFVGGSLLRNRFLYNVLIEADGSALHKIDHHLAVAEAMGFPVSHRELKLFLTLEEIAGAQGKIKEKGGVPAEPFVLFHPGARRWYKSWPIEYFSSLGDKIWEELRIPVVLAGGPGDRERVERIQKGMNAPAINLAGALNLREMAALLKMAALCVVNDSSPMHIAAAVQTPTVSFFGLTDPAHWYPRGEIHRVFSQECPCRPYGHRRECDQGENHCMRKIHVEEVFSAIKAMLHNSASLQKPIL